MNTFIKFFFFLILVLAVGSHSDLGAHGDEDHGGGEEPMAQATGESMRTLSGQGLAFDAVLKYPPFAPGEKVPLTLYVVSHETNRPITGATIEASLSEGDSARTIEFFPAEKGREGVYSAIAMPASNASMSWLFDISTETELDLIPMSGFKAGKDKVATQAAEGHHDDATETTPMLAILISLGALLTIGAFAAGRLSARPKGAQA